jgi:hypothetical protein
MRLYLKQEKKNTHNMKYTNFSMRWPTVKLPEKPGVQILVKKGASALILKNMHVNLVLKIQQSTRSDGVHL